MKTTTKTFVLLALTMMVAITSCKKKENTLPPETTTTGSTTSNGPATTLQTMLTQLATPLQTYVIDANSYHTFTCTNGTRIITYPNSFVTKSGVAVSGNVEIQVKDILSKKDMILNNAFPVSNGQFLISGGEIYFNATQNGQQLKINPAVKVAFLVPTGNNSSYQMQKFYTRGPALLSTPGSSLNWIQNADSTTIIPVIPDSTGSSSFFYFDSDSVNWSNIDMFTNASSALTNCTITTTGNSNSENTMIFISKNGISSVAPIYAESYRPVSQLFRTFFPSLPVGDNYTIGAISFDGTNYYYASVQVTMAANMVISMPPLTQTTKNQIDINLAALP